MHRNLKPDNILLDYENKVVKLADFFQCRDKSSARNQYTPEQPKDRVFSSFELPRIYYKPPEILLRNKTDYDADTDVWRVGCLMVEMQFGEPLFSEKTEISQLFKIFSMLGTPKDVWYQPNGITRGIFPCWEPVDISLVGDEGKLDFSMRHRPDSLECLRRIYEYFFFGKILSGSLERLEWIC